MKNNNINTKIKENDTSVDIDIYRNEITKFPNFAKVYSERRDKMETIEEMFRKIEELRQLMYRLINDKRMLTDTELVAISQKLDKLLNEYNKLISKVT